MNVVLELFHHQTFVYHDIQSVLFLWLYAGVCISDGRITNGWTFRSAFIDADHIRIAYLVEIIDYAHATMQTALLLMVWCNCYMYNVYKFL